MVANEHICSLTDRPLANKLGKLFAHGLVEDLLRFVRLWTVHERTPLIGYVAPSIKEYSLMDRSVKEYSFTDRVRL